MRSPTSPKCVLHCVGATINGAGINNTLFTQMYSYTPGGPFTYWPDVRSRRLREKRRYAFQARGEELR